MLRYAELLANWILTLARILTSILQIFQNNLSQFSLPSLFISLPRLYQKSLFASFLSQRWTDFAEISHEQFQPLHSCFLNNPSSSAAGTPTSHCIVNPSSSSIVNSAPISSFNVNPSYYAVTSYPSTVISAFSFITNPYPSSNFNINAPPRPPSQLQALLAAPPPDRARSW